MAAENDKLHETLHQTEKDTIEVVTFLKQGDIEKDDQVMFAAITISCFVSVVELSDGVTYLSYV